MNDVSIFRLYLMRALLLTVALPLWNAGDLDAATRETTIECLIGVVLCPLVIPWGYVWLNYVKKSGDRWRRSGSYNQVNSIP